jgi:hypothetical protein
VSVSVPTFVSTCCSAPSNATKTSSHSRRNTKRRRRTKQSRHRSSRVQTFTILSFEPGPSRVNRKHLPEHKPLWSKCSSHRFDPTRLPISVWYMPVLPPVNLTKPKTCCDACIAHTCKVTTRYGPTSCILYDVHFCLGQVGLARGGGASGRNLEPHSSDESMNDTEEGIPEKLLMLTHLHECCAIVSRRGQTRSAAQRAEQIPQEMKWAGQ